MDYTEEDAEFDAKLLLKEIEDLNMGGGGIVNSLKNQYSVSQELQSYLKAHRFLEFAKDALSVSQNAKVDLNEISVETRKEDLISETHFKVQVEKITGIGDIIGRSESLDSKMRQLKKDIERDKLLINGVRFIGAEKGLQNILEFIGDQCNEALLNCNLPQLSPEIKEEMAHLTLLKVSRSHAGGICFQATQSYANKEEAMIIPQSSITPPLRITTKVGSFNIENKDGQANRSTWGLICTVSCESWFQLENIGHDLDIGSYSQDSQQNEQMGTHSKSDRLISATYTDQITFEIKLYDNEINNIDNLIHGYDPFSGIVELCSNANYQSF